MSEMDRTGEETPVHDGRPTYLDSALAALIDAGTDDWILARVRAARDDLAELRVKRSEDDRRKRLAHLQVTEQWILRRFGLLLREAFPTARAIVHVGSSLVRQDWRDVDVRIVLLHDDYEMVATVADVKALNVALSLWGQQFTRLPIDCQLQPERDHRAHDDKPLRSIGGLPR